MQYTLTSHPTDRNRDEFYRTLYRVQNLPREQLINIDDISTDAPILIIDSCGWYYRCQFPNHDIKVLESVTTCKDYRLGLEKFDKIFDNRDGKLSWPQIPVAAPILILDQSPILFKYRTLKNLTEILSPIISTYAPREIRMRLSLTTLDDKRFCDRIYHITSIIPAGYVVLFMQYDTDKLRIDLKRKVEIDW